MTEKKDDSKTTGRIEPGPGTDSRDTASAAQISVEPRRPDQLSPLRARTLEEYKRDPTPSAGALIRRAGGSKWTSRNPRQHRMAKHQLQELVLRDPELGKMRPQDILQHSLAGLLRIASDTDHPMQAAALKTLLDHSSRHGGTEEEPTDRQAKLESYWRAVAKAARLGWRLGRTGRPLRSWMEK